MRLQPQRPSSGLSSVVSSSPRRAVQTWSRMSRPLQSLSPTGSRHVATTAAGASSPHHSPAPRSTMALCELQATAHTDIAHILDTARRGIETAANKAAASRLSAMPSSLVPPPLIAAATAAVVATVEVDDLSAKRRQSRSPLVGERIENAAVPASVLQQFTICTTPQPHQLPQQHQLSQRRTLSPPPAGVTQGRHPLNDDASCRSAADGTPGTPVPFVFGTQLPPTLANLPTPRRRRSSSPRSPSHSATNDGRDHCTSPSQPPVNSTTGGGIVAGDALARRLSRRRSSITSKFAGARCERRMSDIVCEGLRQFCHKLDAALAVALAGVPGGGGAVGGGGRGGDGEHADNTNDSARGGGGRSADRLLYSTLPVGVRPWETLVGSATLPSYDALHSMWDVRVCDPAGLPKELMGQYLVQRRS